MVDGNFVHNIGQWIALAGGYLGLQWRIKSMTQEAVKRENRATKLEEKVSVLERDNSNHRDTDSEIFSQIRSMQESMNEIKVSVAAIAAKLNGG